MFFFQTLGFGPAEGRRPGFIESRQPRLWRASFAITIFVNPTLTGRAECATLAFASSLGGQTDRQTDRKTDRPAGH